LFCVRLGSGTGAETVDGTVVGILGGASYFSGLMIAGAISVGVAVAIFKYRRADWLFGKPDSSVHEMAHYTGL